MKSVQKPASMWATIISLCLLVWLSACGKKGCREDEGTRPSDKPLELVRLEDTIAGLKDTLDSRLFLDRHPLFAEKFLQRSKLPHDSILINDMLRLATDPYLDTMGMDVKKEFPDLGWLKNDLGNLFDHVRFYYPEFHNPKVYTLVSGFGTDLDVKDSVVVIGLDYWLSDSSHYRAPQIPAYILRRIKKRFLVPSIGMVVADRFCQIDMLDNTMMAEMMKWGRVYYFMEKTMPCIQDTILTGFTETQLKGVEGNLKTIWAHYVDQNLFFSTDYFLIKKYCDERPSVPEIGNDCPGRIGRWLGWQVVRKWAEDKKLSLQQVMAEKNARKIFNESGFKP